MPEIAEREAKDNQCLAVPLLLCSSERWIAFPSWSVPASVARACVTGGTSPRRWNAVACRREAVRP